MNIFLTGGASGLGLEIFDVLAKAGHRVIFTYNKSKPQAIDNVANHKNCLMFHCDFYDQSSINSLLDQIQLLDIDVLINNALPSIEACQFQRINIDDLTKSFLHNVQPVLRITQACLENFRINRRGRVITILSSYLINSPPTGYSEYTANKAYLASMSKSWANENAKFGITVNTISPSTIDTNLNSKIDKRLLENLASNNPFKKLVSPNDVAKIIEFLITSPIQLNANNLILNGGENVI